MSDDLFSAPVGNGNASTTAELQLSARCHNHATTMYSLTVNRDARVLTTSRLRRDNNVVSGPDFHFAAAVRTRKRVHVPHRIKTPAIVRPGAHRSSAGRLRADGVRLSHR